MKSGCTFGLFNDQYDLLFSSFDGKLSLSNPFYVLVLRINEYNTMYRIQKMCLDSIETIRNY